MMPTKAPNEEGGYSLEQEAQAPQHHPHCCHWRNQGCVEDQGTSEGQLHRAPWGWSCAQAAARRMARSVSIPCPSTLVLEALLNPHLQQQAMDLLRKLLYIRVQRQSWAGGWGSKDVLVQGCPAGQKRPVQSCP